MRSSATRWREKEAVRELAEMDYPKVWIGEAGMTVEEALSNELLNEQLRKEAWEEATPEERAELWANIPEDERGRNERAPELWEDLPEIVKAQISTPFEAPMPSEKVDVGLGNDAAMTFQMPALSEDWIDGLTVYESGLFRHIDPYLNAELAGTVRVIHAAKEGRVPVEASWGLEFMEPSELTEDDILFAKAFTPDGKVLVYTVPSYRYVRVKDLSPQEVDESLLDYLETYASNGPDTMGPFVIEDTEMARRVLAQRRGEE